MTMTRNEFIAQSTMLLCAHQNSPAVYAVDLAKGMAATLEAQGCAPWQDAPPIKRTGVGEYTVDFTQAVDTHPIQFDLPTRRETCVTCEHFNGWLCAVDKVAVAPEDHCAKHQVAHELTNLPKARREITADRLTRPHYGKDSIR